MISAVGSQNYVMMHPGLPRDNPGAYPGDVQFLLSHGLIQSLHRSGSSFSVDVTPEGYDVYAALRAASESDSNVEKSLRRFVDSQKLLAAYGDAISKWQLAEELLWSADNAKQLTAIGHHCREALQEFADVLAKQSGVYEVPADRAKTVARIRAVIDARIQSDEVRAFCNALLAYWGTVSDLAQRQEHGAAKAGDPLSWSDGRRVVFQTLLVMYEINEAIVK
jgi:hypothetical protein